MAARKIRLLKRMRYGMNVIDYAARVRPKPARRVSLRYCGIRQFLSTRQQRQITQMRGDIYPGSAADDPDWAGEGLKKRRN
jgi:hypothetical protein